MLPLILILNLLVRGPDLWWSRHTPPDLWFTGQASWVDQIDLSLYFRIIHQGQLHGSFLIPNFADSMGTEKILIYPVYTLIGMAGSWMNLSPVELFHLAGLAASICLVVTVYWFLGLFITDKRWQMVGLYWSFLAGGFGWLWYPSVIFPDLGVPIFSLWSALRSPHEAISIISLLVCLGAGYQHKMKGVALGAGGILISHPQMLVPVSIILGCWYLIQRKQIWPLLSVLVSVGLIYYLFMGRMVLLSSVSIGLLKQTTYIFPPWYWLVGWGMMGVLAGYEVWRSKKLSFPALWVAIQLSLFYLPLVPYRGMMIRGIGVGLVLLAVAGARRLSFKPVFIGMVVLFLSFGDVWLMHKQRMSLEGVTRSAFVTKDEGKLIDYLSTHAREGDGMVGLYRLSNIVMGATLVTPYVGHYPLTPNFESRYTLTGHFYNGEMTPAEAEAFLKTARVRWVVSVPERQLLYSFITPVATSGGMTLYEAK